VQNRTDRADQAKHKGKNGKSKADAGGRARLSGATAAQAAPGKSQASRPPLELKPMFEAPYYKGSEKLLDKVALITGADSGIGRAVAVLFAREAPI